MILLDTHIWIWWVDGSPQLSAPQRKHIESYESTGLGVSVISCWEVAKLVEVKRLQFQCPVAEWIEQALAYPGIRFLYVPPRIAVESTQLPGVFHRDPADQLIVATSRIRGFPLLTADAKILQYPHVKTLGSFNHDAGSRPGPICTAVHDALLSATARILLRHRSPRQDHSARMPTAKRLESAPASAWNRWGESPRQSSVWTL